MRYGETQLTARSFVDIFRLASVVELSSFEIIRLGKMVFWNNRPGSDDGLEDCSAIG